MKENPFIKAKAELGKICNIGIKTQSQIFCILHSPEHLGQGNKDSYEIRNHSCIGCNLQESLDNIYRFLSENNNKQFGLDYGYTFQVFILLLYLNLEELTTIFKFIGITQEYVQDNWPVLIEIRQWANFVKHPKGFLFTHHPEYLFEGEKKNKKFCYIDKDFIKKLYNHESSGKFEQTIQQIGNKANVKILIPDPVQIIKEYKNVCEKFCDKIKNNEHFREILIKHGTLENYNHLYPEI
jgi:hypothetical protein